MSYDNDSPNWVYFDDFKVTHTTTNVIQYNEYYPFGLRTENSWTREDHSNKFLYNAGAELNANSGWYETFFRGYDAALGRFMQVDPLASVSSSHSPYHYAYNNPVLFNDPLGDRPEEVMRDLEMSGGGAGYQMYDYSDSWTQGFGNNQYGQHRIGPASGNYWSNGYASANQNAAMMSTRTFNDHYRIRNDQDRANLANKIGTTIYQRGSSTDWGRPEDTSGYGEGSLVTNKYGSWILVNGSWFDLTSSDQMANRIAWDQQGAPGDPIMWFGTWKDISSSDYPGIKIYQTSLVVDGTGVTIPGVGILISQTINPGLGMTRMLQHEYGHFLDSKFSPDLNNSFNPTVPSIPFINYMLIIGIPSAFDLLRGSNYDKHHDFYTEKRADQWAEIWFGGNYKGK